MVARISLAAEGRTVSRRIRSRPELILAFIMSVSTCNAIINSFRVSTNACLKLQEVAYKALWAEKRLVVCLAAKGLDLLSLRGRLLTPKLTSAGPNVTILKILQAESIDKLDGLTRAVCWDGLR